MRKRQGDSNREEDEDDTQERSRNVRLYINSVWVLGLTIADVVAFVVFQLFTGPNHDFVCSGSKDTEIRFHVGQIIFLASIIFLHFCYVVQRSSAWEKNVGMLSYTRSWHLITLVASIVVLVTHTEFCGRNPATDFGYSVLLKIDQLVHVFRVMLLVIVCRTLQQDLLRRLQRAVSLYRRRYVDPDRKLDLDITYVADRVLAMSIPCVESAPYRNDISEVARFFASRHYGSFAVLNLCEHQEESGNGNYHPSLLFNQVQKAPMRDHNAPAFQKLVDFCEAATNFLNAGDKNVVAVHCQGGKGRTGLFVCGLLLWVGLFDTAQDVVAYYGKRRSMKHTPKHHLVQPTAPSQLRYLRYLERLIVEGFEFSGFHPLVLDRIIITHPPVDKFAWNMALVVEQDSTVLFDLFKASGTTLFQKNGEDCITININRLLVDGDVTLRIYTMDSINSAIPPNTSAALQNAGRTVKYGSVKGTQTAFISVHTAAVKSMLKGKGGTGVVTFHKSEIDGAHHDTSHRLFSENFSVGMDFSDATESSVDLSLADFHCTKDNDSSKNSSKHNSVSRNNQNSLGDNDFNASNSHINGNIDGDIPIQRRTLTPLPDPPVPSDEARSSPKLDGGRVTVDSLPSLIRNNSEYCDDDEEEDEHVPPLHADEPAVCDEDEGESSNRNSKPGSGNDNPSPRPSSAFGFRQASASLSGGEQDNMTKHTHMQHFAAVRRCSLMDKSALANNHSQRYGIAPCLHDVVAHACSGVRTFHHGEVVLDTKLPEDDETMSIYYCLSGRIQMEPWKTGPIGGWSGCLGMPDVATVATIGKGQLFGSHGLSRIVPGGREVGGGLLYRVKSEEASVAVVKMSKKLHDQPQDSPNMKLDQTNFVLYEWVARQLCDWSRGLRQQLHRQRRPRKANASAASAMAARKLMHERVMELHHLPQDEKVLTNCQASHVSRKRTNGQLLLFKNWLIFRSQNFMGTNNSTNDIKISLEEVSKVTLKKDVLTIQKSSEISQQDTAWSGSPREEGSHHTSSSAGGGSPTLRLGTNAPQSQSTSKLSAGTAAQPTSASKLAGPGQAQSGHAQSFKSRTNTSPLAVAAWRNKWGSAVLGTQRRLSLPKSSVDPELSQVSFVIGGGERSVAGNAAAAAVFEKVVKQQTLVQARIGGGVEELGNEYKNTLRQMVLGDKTMEKRRLSQEGSPSSEEDMLRRWGFVLAGELVDPATQNALSGLMANSPSHRYHTGECLQQAGSMQKHFVFIQSGRVSSWSASGEKLEVRLGGGVMGAKAFFSEGNAGASTTLIAEIETEVLFIQAKALEATCRLCPAAGARFYRALAMHLGVLNTWQFELLGEEEEHEVESAPQPEVEGENAPLLGPVGV